MGLRLLAATLCVIGAYSLSWCSDMTVTLDDGRVAILRSDSTWEFKGAATMSESDDPLSLSVAGGKTLILYPDGTWQIGKGLKVKQSTEVRIKLDEIAGVGSATKTSVTQSTKAATDIAVGKLVDRIRPQINNSKVKRTDVEQCVRGVISDQQVETELQGSNAVKVTILLSKDQLRRVEACIEEQLAAEPPAPEPAKK